MERLRFMNKCLTFEVRAAAEPHWDRPKTANVTMRYVHQCARVLRKKG